MKEQNETSLGRAMLLGLISLCIADHDEMSSRHRNWYGWETDLFETLLQCPTSAYRKLINSTLRSNVPNGTLLRLTNLITS